MKRLSLEQIVMLAVIVLQVIFTMIAGLRQQRMDSWITIHLQSGDDTVLAVPSGQWDLNESRQWLIQWVEDQQGSVRSYQVQSPSRILLHTLLGRCDGDEVSLDLDLTELQNFEPSLHGVKVEIPQFAQVLELETTRAVVQRQQTYLGPVLVVTSVPGEGRMGIKVHLRVSWEPALLLALTTLLAALATFVMASILRSRDSAHRELLAQTIPFCYLITLFCSGPLSYFDYKVGTVLTFVIIVLVSGILVAAGSIPLIKGQQRAYVRAQVGLFLALQTLPMVLFLFLRISLGSGRCHVLGRGAASSHR